MHGSSLRVCNALCCAMTAAALVACERKSAQQQEKDPEVQPAAALNVPAQPATGSRPGEWTMPALDYANTRYSTLAQINTANVKNLKIFATFSTGVQQGHEGQPLVVNNTMYVVTPFPNLLYALDLTKAGAPVKWSYDPHADERSVGIACCDIVNRGAFYDAGKIFYNTLDAHTVAVDANTGKQIWNTRVGDISKGETITMAPIVAHGKVYVGNSGAELGVRGYLAALDENTGAILWRAFTTGPDRDVLIGPKFKPFYASDRGTDLGVRSWTGEQWKLGGGTVWGWLAYDPQLNLIYYGTANPGVWNPDLRPGDNKWATSLIARDADTGEMRWAYQMTPHDAWDYDGVNENLLADLPIKGRVRKVLVHPDRNGFAYTVDRETGEVLVAEKYALTNWAKSIDLRTGRPIEDLTKRSRQGVVTTNICPSSTGAKDEPPSAFSPRTGWFYIPAHNLCMDYEGVEANYIAGTPYTGANVKMYPGPGGYRGQFMAWDATRGAKVWEIKENFPLWSGVLATAGDVVFYGTMDGWFKAVDARNGTELWKTKLGSGIVGNPMTYTGPDGRQYVAIYAGIGGWLGVVAFPDVSLDDPYTALGAPGTVMDIKKATALGGMLYVFALEAS